MLIIKDLDIFVVFPTLFQNFIGKVRRALIINPLTPRNLMKFANILQIFLFSI